MERSFDFTSSIINRAIFYPLRTSPS